MRVLDWIVRRVHGRAYAIESPIGWMPRFEDLNFDGMPDFGYEQFDALMAVDREEWKAESLSHEELFLRLLDRLPKELVYERLMLISRLWRSPAQWHLASEIAE
jgi:phosphoenolpyruvate carboxykinase (GTP)